MTTDSGWDNEMTTVDEGNAFTDVTALDAHEHGYCDLYRARRHGKWHVLKALKDDYRDTPACQTMLHKEFDIGYHLSHPGIAATMGLEQVEGLGECIVEEWVDGIRLDEFISSSGFNADVARDLIRQLCDVLKYIHARQVVHRDLKPSNILITADGNRVKVIDFGVSDTASHAVLKGPAGTRAYAAPELLAGENADSRADIYSLGVIIDQMNKRLPTRDHRLEKIAQWCMNPDREQRPASVVEVLAALSSRNKFVRYLLVATAVFAALMMAMTIAMVIRFALPHSDSSSHAPASDTTAVDTTAGLAPAPETTGDTAITAPQPPQPPPAQSAQSVQSVQPAQSVQSSVQEEKTVKLPPTLRQLFLAKAASVGMSAAINNKEDLDEVLRLQGKDAFDRRITQYMKEWLEDRLMITATEMFQNDLSHNKAMREFLLTDEGHKLMDAGRKVAFEYAHERLQQLYPGQTIPPFPNDKKNWFE